MGKIRAKDNSKLNRIQTRLTRVVKCQIEKLFFIHEYILCGVTVSPLHPGFDKRIVLKLMRLSYCGC